MTVYNFSAGPAMLPPEVMCEAKQEFLDWQQQGVSVMEISHRSAPFLALMQQAEQDVRDVLAVPDDYDVLFMHGGARGQFAAVAQNFLGDGGQALYLQSGFWSTVAAEEAKRFADVVTMDIVQSCVKTQTKRVVLPELTSDLGDFRYVHYCPNETLEGLCIDEELISPWPVVADMTSCLFERPLNIRQFGLIYAGAQKNIGIAGFALVIVRRDMLKLPSLPVASIMDYRITADNHSIYNTPTTFAVYLAAKIFKWIQAQGGLTYFYDLNQRKAELIYAVIDSSPWYHNRVAIANRSRMNVTFELSDPRQQSLFLATADKAGLKALTGHRLVGGCRASMYNAMPLTGAVALAEFMRRFVQTTSTAPGI